MKKNKTKKETHLTVNTNRHQENNTQKTTLLDIHAQDIPYDRKETKGARLRENINSRRFKKKTKKEEKKKERERGD